MENKELTLKFIQDKKDILKSEIEVALSEFKSATGIVPEVNIYSTYIGDFEHGPDSKFVRFNIKIDVKL